MSAADTARRLIAKYGRADGNLQRPTQALETDPLRPWSAADAVPAVSPTVAADLNVVVLDALTVRRREDLLPDQTAVAYLDADVEPKVLDTILTRGKTYLILQVTELAPGVETCLYTLDLKGR